MINDFEISAFGFRAAHGGHAILSVLAVFIDGMTVCALMSESNVLDVAALTNPTLHTSASGFRLGYFAQPGKSARLVVPRVADWEDVRRSGTMDDTSRQRRCPVCVVRTGSCSTTERRSTRPVPRPVADGQRR